MNLLRLSILPVFAAACLSSASAAPIPGLFNTGLNAEGQLIESSDVADAHYQLIESPDENAPGPNAVTLNPGFPVGPWLEEGPDSRWIAPRADQGQGSPPANTVTARPSTSMGST